MPNEINKGFNFEEKTSEGNGQPENKSADNKQSPPVGSGEEKVSISKSELDKIILDRDNYREGLLAAKAKNRSLGKDDTLPLNNAPLSTEIDEEKVRNIAQEVSGLTFSQIEKSNQERAKVKFFRNRPEYLEDSQWSGLISNFHARRGNATVEDIIDDFEDAVILHKRSIGKLDDYLKSERERGRQEGNIEAAFRNFADAGGVGNRQNVSDNKTLSPEQEAMARRFKNDPQKVVEVKLGNPQDEGYGSIANPMMTK